MSALREAMSHAVLGWVKPELDESLRQVRSEIEAFVEEPADTSRMRFCAGYLHQVQGTLRMVELYAPAMVAEELELLAQALQEGQADNRDEACATLMRGAVLLPDYLERLQDGHRDIPIVLLPLLNEIRAARGAAGIHEGMLFPPGTQADTQAPTEEELDHARGSLSGRNRELLDTVGGAVKEELLRVKDALDLHLRTQDDANNLHHQVKELGNVADTLGMMGLGVARGVVLQQRDALREVADGKRAANEDTLLDIAGALLYVDASLDDQVARLGHIEGGPNETTSAAESQNTVEVLAQEAINNFASAREKFVAFIETNWDHQELAEVPRLLEEVAGALRMLELVQAADYLIGVRRYVGNELIGKRRIPGGQQLDTLADAMASLEYYLEALRERRPNREDILEITRTSLENLHYWPLPEELVFEQKLAQMETPLAIAPVAIPPGLPANDSTPHPFDPVGFEEPALEEDVAHGQDDGLVWSLDERAAVLVDIPVADGTFDDGALEEGKRDDGVVAVAIAEVEPAPGGELVELQLMQEVPVVAPAVAMAALGTADGFDGGSSDIDDEIREVFLEEFDEEIVNLGQLLPAWRATPEDMDRLRPIRRVFHTLKGSGRLVGAKTLGEFSWKIENMLNRVLDNSRPPTDAVIELLEQSCEVLPQLNAALRGQGEITADLEGLKAIADRIASGEEVLYQSQPEAVVQRRDDDVPAVLADDNVALLDLVVEDEGAGTPASVDAVLREILEAEVATHLETVRGWLASAHPQPVDDALLRAVHTMNGAFAMADVPEITEVTGPAEHYIKRSLSAAVIPSADGLSALRSMVRAIEQTIQALKAPLPRIPVFAELSATLHALKNQLPEARAASQLVNTDAQGTYASLSAVDAAVAGAPAELTAHDLSAYLGSAGLLGDSNAVASLSSPALESADAEVDAISADLKTELEAAANAKVIAPRGEVTYFEVEYTFTPRNRADEAHADSAEVAASGNAAEAAQVEEVTTSSGPIEELETVALAELVAGSVETEVDGGYEVEEIVLETPDELTEVEAAQVDAGQVEEAIADIAAQPQEIALADATDTEIELAEALERLAATEATPAGTPASEYELGVDEALVDQPEIGQFEVIETVEIPLEAANLEFAAVAETETELPSAQVAEETTEASIVASEPEVAEIADAQVAEAEDQELPVTAAHSSAESIEDALDTTGLDLELVDIFVEEGNDLLDHSDDLLAKLRETPEDRSLVTGLQRDLHTLKGGARMAGIHSIGDLGHAIESMLESIMADRTQLDQRAVQLLERGFDSLHGMVGRVGAHRTAHIPEGMVAEFNAHARGLEPVLGQAAADALQTAKVDVDLAPLSAPVETELVQEEEFFPASQQEQVRVRADLLDQLVNHAGEVAIYRARLEQQLGAFRGAMSELDRTNTRLHDQLRRLDLETEAQIVARYQREHEKQDPTFDPLELDRFSTLQQLSRALAESAADLTGLQGVLDDLARQYDGLLHQQSRVSSELQDGLMRARMVPFEGIVPRLRRVLRQAASDTGKQVKLQLSGTHGEMDRNVLERMTAPLEHLMRNSVAHGLESPKARRNAGKGAEGTVQVALRREGSEMVLEVSDDGGGLNRNAIRQRAEQRGLLQAGAQIDDADLDRMILESGFSTYDQVSQLAGRGVGMDVVYNEVRQLGGSLDISSRPGKGATFTLRLPQTLAVTQAVFVQIGETQFAVPVAAVSGIGRISRERFEADGGVYHYGGEDYVLHNLGGLVGHAPARAEGQPQIPLLLVRAGELRAAVAVDQVLGNREIVVKPVGPQIASIPGIYGATITGDGSIVVILDVAPLVRRHLTQPQLPAAPNSLQQQRHVPLVMVVDDSLTMRKVTSRVLERHNLEVMVARDGVEALERLDERVPDLMLLDIEMPRMDGYELATAMKADARFKDVPIVMITSRTGDKHRQRAFDIGVQRYMGKPYQELDLMRNVYDLLGIARVRE